MFLGGGWFVLARTKWKGAIGPKISKTYYS